ncbi:unnamed protein product, partial [Rangifer tarandus platyrhynchus]
MTDTKLKEEEAAEREQESTAAISCSEGPSVADTEGRGQTDRGRREREKSESSVLSSPRIHSRVALGSATCHSRRKRNILFTKLTAWNLCVPSGPQTPPLAVRGTQPPTQPHVLCTLDG